MPSPRVGDVLTLRRQQVSLEKRRIPPSFSGNNARMAFTVLAVVPVEDPWGTSQFCHHRMITLRLVGFLEGCPFALIRSGLMAAAFSQEGSQGQVVIASAQQRRDLWTSNVVH